MSTKAYIDKETNKIVTVYYRNKWVCVLISLLFSIFALLYSREYKVFWILVVMYLLIIFGIPSESPIQYLPMLVNIGLLGRFLFMGQSKFDKVVNRED